MEQSDMRGGGRLDRGVGRRWGVSRAGSLFSSRLRVVLALGMVVMGGARGFGRQTPASVPLTAPLAINRTNLVLTWVPVGFDIYGNPLTVSNYNIYCSTDPFFAPDLGTHTNRLGSATTGQFLHTNALATGSNLFYYITAVGTSGSESLVCTNLVGKLAWSIVCPPGSNVFAWLALPPSVAWTNASSLAAQLGIAGKLHRLDEASQSDEVWDAGAGTGTDFLVKAGEAYLVELSTNALLQVHGTYDTAAVFNWVHNTNELNHHWISVPPNSIYSNAAALAADIPAATKVAVYDPASGQFLSWFKVNTNWLGTNFSLSPAQGVIISIASNASWQPRPAYPQAAVSLQAGAGFIDLANMQATGAVVAGASPIVEYAWDYFGDGNMELLGSSAVPLLSVQVTNAATCWPTYRVRDARGFYGLGSARYDALSMSLSFTNQAFRAGLGETGSISFASSQAGYFTAYVYDGSNNLVRVLESNLWHAAGSGVLRWDGRNGAGTVVGSGAYYVVLDQTVNGVTARYDPKRLLLGTNITSSVSGISVPSQFNPYKGGFFPIQYTLPSPAQVTVVIQDASLNTIAVVCTNALRAAGNQVEYWDGRLSNGSVLAGGQTFRVTINALALGANAMIIQQALPTLTSLRISAATFTPSRNPYGLGTNAVTLTYTLDGTADVRFIVRDSQGRVIQDALEAGKPAGLNTGVWAGTDSLGRLAVAGIYTISAAPEVSGQSGASRVVWVQVYY